jgi:hypothetical protein
VAVRLVLWWVVCTPTIANTNLNAPNKTTAIVGSNLQANANNAVNSDNANNAEVMFL